MSSPSATWFDQQRLNQLRVLVLAAVSGKMRIKAQLPGKARPAQASVPSNSLRNDRNTNETAKQILFGTTAGAKIDKKATFATNNKSHPPPTPSVPSRPLDKGHNADKPSYPPVTQIVFETAVDADFKEDSTFHLGTENISDRVTTQIGVKDAPGATIKKGFYGAGSQTLAKEIAEINVRGKMALDVMQMDLAKEKLRLQQQKASNDELRESSIR
ncbi:hypothetical protein D9619_011282 [Psilocybe cf. subviscida]|uniref:Uncharacterized protein n=1 Tax=Psilocybe cf. subviscida TaxID=2480587 RepID=A0A8H5BIW4_9AGAR|nr:hypothetical protein D9619_011282 [Psilocybe cf. subviscida]